MYLVLTRYVLIYNLLDIYVFSTYRIYVWGNKWVYTEHEVVQKYAKIEIIISFFI